MYFFDSGIVGGLQRLRIESFFLQMKNIKYLLIISLLLLSFIGNGQIDSWKSLNSQALEYYTQGNYRMAQEYYKKALTQAENEFGKNNLNYARACSNLAFLYKQLGNYSIAEKYYQEAKEFFFNEVGKNNSSYATVCNSLAQVYNAQGNYSKAEELYLEAKEIRAAVLGKTHWDYANSCNDLAGFYYDQANYQKAEPLYLEAIYIYSAAFGENHPECLNSMNNLATLYQAKTDFSKAEPLLIKVKELRAEALGSSHPDYAISCNNLAGFYFTIGNYFKAQPLYLEAQGIIEQVYGHDHPVYATLCNNLAQLFERQKNYSKAEIFYLESKEIRAKVLGKEHPDYANSCINLGELYMLQQEYSKAEALTVEARDVFAKVFGLNHPLYATSCNNLAVLYDALGDYSKAENFNLISLEIRVKILGKSHPDYAISCNNLAQVYCATGNYSKAVPLYNESMDILLRQIENTFSFLSETEQQLYYQSLKYFFDAYALFALKYYSHKQSISSDLYDLQLAIKGLIFQSSQKLRLRIIESGDSELSDKYENLKSRRNYLAGVYRMSLLEKEKQNLDEKELEGEVNTLEKELTVLGAKYNIKGNEDEKRYTWQDVKSKLKPGEAAIEIIRAREYELGKDTVYVALIINSETIGQPELVVLESGATMEGRGIRFYRNNIQQQTEDSNSFNLFWKPIGDRLKGIKKVYFSPDGVYHRISLATLKNPSTGKYLIDELMVQIVGCTRDLTEKHNFSMANEATLFGFPDYRGDGNIATLTPLPGTEAEVKSINQLLIDKKIPSVLFTGKQATEKKMKELRDPKILHIATHGFFLPDIEHDLKKIGMQKSSLTENPLFRSGLLLANCEESLQEEDFYYKEEDGILTAYEAMNLFLDETDLVVLSACETGLGEIQNGEGVYGLQRAFQQAGAKTVLISLWKVSDSATQLLMTTMYKEYLQTGNLNHSFITAQQLVRAQYPKPYYWGAFVMIGE